jgi:hypothetical protein
MSAEAGPIRILAVDDRPVVRHGIAGLVAVHSDMSLVAEASNGREANRHRDISLRRQFYTPQSLANTGQKLCSSWLRSALRGL